jgi:hypothetical protein
MEQIEETWLFIMEDAGLSFPYAIVDPQKNN